MLALAGVNFVHSGWYGPMFWIYAEHRVDSIEMSFLLLSSVYKAKDFSAFYTALLAKEAGRTHSQNRHPNSPKGYSRL